METNAQALSLTLPNDLRLLLVARAFMESVCQAARLAPGDTDAIVLAVHEAVSNSMRHAHENQPGAHLEIHCFVDAGRVEIHVLDEGEPFDLDAVPELSPSELRIGGRGVFLMRALMDELSCEPRGQRGNILRMVKHCRGGTRLSDCG